MSDSLWKQYDDPPTSPLAVSEFPSLHRRSGSLLKWRQAVLEYESHIDEGSSTKAVRRNAMCPCPVCRLSQDAKHTSAWNASGSGPSDQDVSSTNILESQDCEDDFLRSDNEEEFRYGQGALHSQGAFLGSTPRVDTMDDESDCSSFHENHVLEFATENGSTYFQFASAILEYQVPKVVGRVKPQLSQQDVSSGSILESQDSAEEYRDSEDSLHNPHTPLDSTQSKNTSDGSECSSFAENDVVLEFATENGSTYLQFAPSILEYQAPKAVGISKLAVRSKVTGFESNTNKELPKLVADPDLAASPAPQQEIREEECWNNEDNTVHGERSPNQSSHHFAPDVGIRAWHGTTPAMRRVSNARPRQSPVSSYITRQLGETLYQISLRKESANMYQDLRGRQADQLALSSTLKRAEEVTTLTPADNTNEEFQKIDEYGAGYQNASRFEQLDKPIVCSTVAMTRKDLKFAPRKMKNNKEAVSLACRQDGMALKYANRKLQNDKEVVLIACSQNGLAVELASRKLRNDKEVAMTACIQNGDALQHCGPTCRENKGIVLAACCNSQGDSIQYAQKSFRNDHIFLRTLIYEHGGWKALKHAPIELRSDKEVVLKACQAEGSALEFASSALRANKEVVLAATRSNPESLKFALAGLNQDKDCLIMAGLWDDDYIERQARHGGLPLTCKTKIVLSTKFSLSAESSAHATRFTVELKKHPYIANGNFVVYSPNAFSKGTCDPNWTDPSWPCRGTYFSCQKGKAYKAGVPRLGADCCWRYSFRYHLREASRLDGCMIQVVDLRNKKDSRRGADQGDHFVDHTLGNGQSIETEMAEDVGIKVFRFFEPLPSEGQQRLSYAEKVDELVRQIQDWQSSSRVRRTSLHKAPFTASAQESWHPKSIRKTPFTASEQKMMLGVTSSHHNRSRQRLKATRGDRRTSLGAARGLGKTS